MSADLPKSTAKGEAFDRLLLALVAQSPMRPDREKLISSQALAAAHRTPEGLEAALKSVHRDEFVDLSETEKRNAAKALGRMVSSGALREVVIPNGSDERVNLKESGLIAVSVSLPVLNAEHDAWEKSGKIGPEPNQEWLAQEIRDRTIDWIVSEREDHGIPLFLKDVLIVHGSSSFDLLILVMYRSSRDFMAYVREVIQRVRGVLGTQTMQISNNLAANDVRAISE